MMDINVLLYLKDDAEKWGAPPQHNYKNEREYDKGRDSKERWIL